MIPAALDKYVALSSHDILLLLTIINILIIIIQRTI